MGILYWVIVAIIALAIVFVCAFLGKRKPPTDLAPDPQGHGVDLQARRKTFDDVT